MARHCPDHRRRPHHLLHNLVYSEVRMLRPLLLLPMLLLYEVLWKLLRMLRYPQGYPEQTSRRRILKTDPGLQDPGANAVPGGCARCARPDGSGAAAIRRVRGEQEERRGARGRIAGNAQLGDCREEEGSVGRGRSRNGSPTKTGRQQSKCASHERWNIWPRESPTVARPLEQPLRTACPGQWERILGG